MSQIPGLLINRGACEKPFFPTGNDEDDGIPVTGPNLFVPKGHCWGVSHLAHLSGELVSHGDDLPSSRESRGDPIWDFSILRSSRVGGFDAMAPQIIVACEETVTTTPT